VSVWIGYSSIVPKKSHWANRSRTRRSSSREQSINQINITSFLQWRVHLITIFLSSKTSRCGNSHLSWITTRWPPRIRKQSQVFFGDRLQSPKRRVSFIKDRRWIMSRKFVISTTHHRHKPSECTYKDRYFLTFVFNTSQFGEWKHKSSGRHNSFRPVQKCFINKTISCNWGEGPQKDRTRDVQMI
jgi:hypothetical protein